MEGEIASIKEGHLKTMSCDPSGTSRCPKPRSAEASGQVGDLVGSSVWALGGVLCVCWEKDAERAGMRVSAHTAPPGGSMMAWGRRDEGSRLEFLAPLC